MEYNLLIHMYMKIATRIIFRTTQFPCFHNLWIYIKTYILCLKNIALWSKSQFQDKTCLCFSLVIQVDVRWSAMELAAQSTLLIQTQTQRSGDLGSQR